MKFWYLPILMLFFISCGYDSDSVKDEQQSMLKQLDYAKGFSIEEKNNLKIITIKDAWRGETNSQKYVLYRDSLPNNYKEAVKVKIPIKSIACLSLTHMAFVEALGLENTIVAASGCNYTNSSKIKRLVQNNKIAEVGDEQSINYEVLVENNPSIVMAYGVDESSLTYINKVNQLGLVTVLNAEYMETHPLGKAEWIKFVAAFYDVDEKADSIFKYTKNEYLALTDLTRNIINKPTVFVGMPWNGNWYVAGGKSFQAQLFRDAGGDYLWNDNEEKSSLVKSKEVVYDEAYNADFWLNQNSYTSISAIIEYDDRLKSFKAIKNTMIYNNDNRVNEFSGNDYWESATVYPQRVLKDLIKIFHPELIKHELYYYRKLE